MQEDWDNVKTCWRERGEGVGEEPNIATPQERLVLYKSFNAPCADYNALTCKFADWKVIFALSTLLKSFPNNILYSYYPFKKAILSVSCESYRLLEPVVSRMLSPNF